MDRLGANTTAPVGERRPRCRSLCRRSRARLHRLPAAETLRQHRGRQDQPDVDQSRVINTEDVVQVRPRVREINKLVIHENETRNVGVIQHNHRIVEKETRYVKRAPVYRRAVPAYRVPRVQTVLVPVVVQPVQNCGCPCTCSGSHSAYAAAYVYGAGYADDRDSGDARHGRFEQFQPLSCDRRL